MTNLAIDLEDAGILRFEFRGTDEEWGWFMGVASVPRFKDQAYVDVGPTVLPDPARSFSPYEYDRETLPLLVRGLVNEA
ncbi:MAG: hypothetical protein M3P49_01260 [Actinomycetota bacterium]|nr:hypothetical protein [Actinomycetota bacterium]